MISSAKGLEIGRVIVETALNACIRHAAAGLQQQLRFSQPSLNDKRVYAGSGILFEHPAQISLTDKQVGGNLLQG